MNFYCPECESHFTQAEMEEANQMGPDGSILGLCDQYMPYACPECGHCEFQIYHDPIPN